MSYKLKSSNEYAILFIGQIMSTTNHKYAPANFYSGKSYSEISGIGSKLKPEFFQAFLKGQAPHRAHFNFFALHVKQK